MFGQNSSSVLALLLAAIDCETRPERMSCNTGRICIWSSFKRRTISSKASLFACCAMSFPKLFLFVLGGVRFGGGDAKAKEDAPRFNNGMVARRKDSGMWRVLGPNLTHNTCGIAHTCARAVAECHAAMDGRTLLQHHTCRPTQRTHTTLLCSLLTEHAAGYSARQWHSTHHHGAGRGHAKLANPRQNAKRLPETPAQIREIIERGAARRREEKTERKPEEIAYKPQMPHMWRETAITIATWQPQSRNHCKQAKRRLFTFMQQAGTHRNQ